MPFVHLRTHTEYSVVDGTLRISEALEGAASDGQAALAVTDLSNLFACVKFYSAARKMGIKPLIGADVWLEPDAADRPLSRLLLLVQNHQGYLNLCQLLSQAWLTNGQHQQACIQWDWLHTWGGGLIALSGAEHGALGHALLAQDQERAQRTAQRLSGLFPDRFYIELQRAGLPGQTAYVAAAVPLASALGLPVVATHPVQFLTAEDFEAHEARVCVAQGEILTNPQRIQHFTPEQFLKSQTQMQALFADLPQALENTVHIARRCSLTLVLGKPQLPDFATPLREDGSPMPMAEYFRTGSLDGLHQRLLALYPTSQDREREQPRYIERLNFEVDTILAMGFPGYFLIVADFINWAKKNGCPVGPGRGSGAGSLVAYALKITDLDPLRYNLLFERFLNPERVSMPDFDIDFCQANRDRVIGYVKQKYGHDAVSQIVTFGTMAAKAALRDVGRVLGMGYGHVDGIAKLVPSPPGKTVTLRRPSGTPDSSVIYARLEAPEIEERASKEEEIGELLSLAERVEGLVRNVGMHAGGVLIAPGRITDFCPLYLPPGSSSAVSQFDKDDVEAIGLVKFDFLGLATLTILEMARSFICQRHADQKDFSFDHVPLDDPAAYRLMSEGKTVAVFQLESTGMQRMLRDAKPSVFEDIIALVALYRPGPMDLIPSFCARKHGREEVAYPHPLMREVLQETYGIMVYQEQVMQVAQRLGGYSLGGADLLRRAMGKKKLEEMMQHRALFAAGAAKNGISLSQANEIFDLMEKFAGYGFNKSHAAAYALLAYHTAWLKVRYPAEFTAANMSVALDDTDKLKIFYDDALHMGLRFELPDVNQGVYRFEPVADRVVRYGLGAVKGTGQSAIEALMEARERGGPFKSLFDFCARVDRSRLNKRALDALIKAGAFDSLHAERASMVASISLAFDYADSQAAHAVQAGLFDFDDSPASSTLAPPLIETESWSIKERLLFEKAALGFYLSGHLFDQSALEVREFARRTIADASATDSREPQLLAGIVSNLRVINGMRGRMALFQLDDQSASIEAMVSEELLVAHKDLLKDDELLIVQGKVQPDRFSGGVRLTVTALWDLPIARCRFGKYLYFPLPGKGTALHELLKSFPGRRIKAAQGEVFHGLTVRLMVHCASAQALVDLGHEGRIFPSEEALAFCKKHTQGQAKVVYSD